MVKKILLLLTIVFFCSSCVSRKKIAYFQNISETSLQTNVYQPTLQPGDLISVSINAPYGYEELILPFKAGASAPGASAGMGGEEGGAASQGAGISYLLDGEGNVTMPVLGKVKLAGLTKEDALSVLSDKIGAYVKDPMIDLRILNFKFTVLGEVAKPGTYNIIGERFTLPQALGMAGDLTLYGLRDNILIVREKDGVKTYNYIDITKADFMQTEYYYVTQNDLIVVEPNKTQRNSSAIGRDITIILSTLSILITLASVITR